MKRERKQPTRRELAGITSRRPVVRRVPAGSTGGQPDRSSKELLPIGPVGSQGGVADNVG